MSTDRFTIRVVVAVLAAVVLCSLLAMILLHPDQSARAFLTHAFDIALGALGALLAKTSTFNDDLNALAAAPKSPESDV